MSTKVLKIKQIRYKKTDQAICSPFSHCVAYRPASVTPEASHSGLSEVDTQKGVNFLVPEPLFKTKKIIFNKNPRNIVFLSMGMFLFHSDWQEF